MTTRTLTPLSPVDPYAPRFSVIQNAIDSIDAMLATQRNQIKRLQEEAKRLNDRIRVLEGEI